MKVSTHFLKHSLVTLLGLGLATSPANAFSINPTSNGNRLVDSIVGPDISVSNITYKGASLASGTFKGGLSSGIGIDSGIILTSGTASLAAGPNNSNSSGENNLLPEDADLNSLIGEAATYDATVLEFDFETAGGDLSFNYVFASEEYNEYINTKYNDTFGFFVDGKNIATIPGTTTPVSVNNVNGGAPLGTNATNPEFYNNNDLSDGGFFDIEYDGFTDVFTATAPRIGPGTHTIKLAVADTGDSVLDSAVFIEGKSFSGEPVPEPLTILGSGIALGFGALMKRQHSRKCKNKQIS